ncbi:IclR family transcriptional regulator [Virgisporangium ochraceum]|uniref:Glycerol operon regulatory protein n=1 Tax=Virgisporangium ochraceum TaxID=65505 RepID=A0A8J4E8B4_9ACTN|nr:IclR family transcriptional regulator [Virgisporangium ochraceum]GIJ65471.1 IclR family transcriptional regulator [Virgisporangium ochraceum]
MDDGFQPVKSADRTLDVLEALAGTPGDRSLGELTRALGIPKSSLHGILRTMVRRGWVEADEAGTRFRLGLRAVQIGASYVDGDDAVARYARLLDGLAAAFGETVHLGRLSGPDVTYLAKRESVHPLRLYSAIGRMLPAHATALGKALLAQRGDATVEDLLHWPLASLTPNTITDRGKLFGELATIRALRWAADREENTVGISCFAVALGPHDAISVSIPTARLDTGMEARLISALLDVSGAA